MKYALWFGLGLVLACSCGGTTEAGGGATGGSAGAAAAGGAAGTGGTAGTGGGVAGTGGGVAGTGGGVGGSGGAAKNSGDCNGDSDCGDGKCLEMTPGGYRVCVSPFPEATYCQSPPDAGGYDECCNSADCKTGKCYETPLTPYCGGMVPAPQNQCGKDECTDGSCGPGQVCALAGSFAFKVRGCLPAACLLDTDCTAAPGGKCQTVDNPCCNSPMGLYCVYPGTGCRRASDCKSDEHCGVEQGNVPKCLPGMVGCPA